MHEAKQPNRQQFNNINKQKKKKKSQSKVAGEIIVQK